MKKPPKQSAALNKVRRAVGRVREDGLCLGNQLVDELEETLASSVIRRRAMFRYHKVDRHSWAHHAETAISDMMGVRNCLLLPSATVGLDLLFEALDLPPGAKVLTSPFGWVALYSAVQRRGCRLAFCDLDDELQIDMRSFRRKAATAACVIIPHMLGRAQRNIGVMADHCRERGIPLIEDFAQSFGVKVGGRYAGTFGDAAYCSLNHHKVLGTGDGGFIVTDRNDLFESVVKGHDQGCLQKNGKRKVAPERFAPGNSLRATELTGAMVAAQLARFPLLKASVEALYRRMRSELAGAGLREIEPGDGDLPYVLMLENRPGLEPLMSLAESGWHLVWKVPPTSGLEFAKNEKQMFSRIEDRLRTISLVGCGFVDDYFSTPLGASIRP